MSPPVTRIPSDETLPPSADVVVIGGGIVGITAPPTISPGRAIRSALVEKGHIAGEQSSRNWGWCRQQNRDLRELPMATSAPRHVGAAWTGSSAQSAGFRRTGLALSDERPGRDRPAGPAGATSPARSDASSRHVLSAAEAAATRPGRPASPGTAASSPRPTARPIPRCRAGDRPSGASASAPPSTRIARRAGSRLGRPRLRRGHGDRHDPHQRRAARRRRLDLLFCRHHGIRLAAGRRALDLVLHAAPAPQITEGGISHARRHVPPPASDGGYTIGISGTRHARARARSSSAVRPAVLPIFKKRYKRAHLRVGRSGLRAGPERRARWAQRHGRAVRAHAHPTIPARRRMKRSASRRSASASSSRARAT